MLECTYSAKFFIQELICVQVQVQVQIQILTLPVLQRLLHTHWYLFYKCLPSLQVPSRGYT